MLAVSYGINGCQGLSHFIINGQMKPLRGGTMMGSHSLFKFALKLLFWLHQSFRNARKLVVERIEWQFGTKANILAEDALN